MYKRTGFQILHVILGIIILLNILDFFEFLDPFWDYIKKIISWFLVGILFYRLSPSRVVLGIRKRAMDFWYVVAAFALTINDMLQYVLIARNDMVGGVVQYLGFVRGSGAANLIVTNISESAWNSLTLAGFVPDAPIHLSQIATNITMAQPAIGVAFERLGERIVYDAIPYGMNGALLQVYNSIVPHMSAISEWGVILGLFVLLIWSFVAAVRVPVRESSFVGLFDSGEAAGLARISARFLTIFAVLVFFFLFVFSLVMEWLAIAIDAPILMVAIAVSLLLAYTHRQAFTLGKWEEWVMSIGADFAEPFVKLFSSKKTVLLGLSGLLVLHLLTEIANYLLPFATPMRDRLYLAQLGAGHENLFLLLGQEFSGALLHDVSLIAIGIVNVIAWLGLLAIPGYIWYKLFCLRNENHERHLPHFPPFFLALYTASLSAMLLAPLIWFRRLDEGNLIGVDFFTRSYAESGAIFLPVGTMLFAIGVFVVVFFLAHFAIRRFLYLIPIISSILFMGIYSFLFFMSAFRHYLVSGMVALRFSHELLGIAFFLFLVYSAIFYTSGFIFFVYEIVRD